MGALLGKKVAVYGMARSGQAAARLLLRERAHVTCVDARAAAELGQGVSALLGSGARWGSPTAALLREQDLVVVSPGVPLALPELREVREAGVKVIGEVELAGLFLPGAQVVGITGTNGKSTTTALTGELLSRAGLAPFVGGNLGRPLCEAALEGGVRWVVAELSSYQLEGVDTLRVNRAALLNLTPDHLDRYESHQAYGEAKARIFLNQREGDAAVVNADDPQVVSLAQRAKVPVYGFSLKSAPGPGKLAGLALPAAGGFAFTFGGRPSFRVDAPALRGEHNLQNAMAAALLAHLSGAPDEAVQAGLTGFAGLPHRLESVRVLDGVEWVNDSKATNVDSSLVALRAFQGERLWLIAGGKGKGAPYAPMVQASRGKVRGVLTVGDDAPVLERAYAPAGFAVHPCGTLEAAVAKARALARTGDVVLLSPACASFDQFKNFEHRGDTFKRLVKEQ